MPDIRNRYPGFLKGSELEGDVDVTILEVDALPDNYNRTVIHFTDGSSLAANAQQVRMIANIMKTWETNDWVGRVIQLYPERIDITDRDTGQPKQVDTIRVRSSPLDDPAKAALHRDQPKQLKPLDEELGDDVPF